MNRSLGTSKFARLWANDKSRIRIALPFYPMNALQHDFSGCWRAILRQFGGWPALTSFAVQTTQPQRSWPDGAESGLARKINGEEDSS